LEVNFQDWDNEIYDSYAYLLFKPLFTFLIDKKQDLNKRVSVEINYPNGVSKITKSGIDNYMLHEKLDLLRIDFGLRNGVYEKSEGIELLIKKCKEIFNHQSELKRTNAGNVGKALEDCKSLKTKDHQKNMDTKKIIKIYLDNNSVFNKVDELKNGEEPITSSWQRCRTKCQKGIRDFIQSINFREKLRFLKNKKEIIKNELISCKARYAAALISNYNFHKLKKNEFEKLINEVKNRFFSSILPDFSLDTRVRIKDYFQNIKFVSSNINAVKKFKKNLNNLFEESKSLNIDYSSQPNTYFLSRFFKLIKNPENSYNGCSLFGIATDYSIEGFFNNITKTQEDSKIIVSNYSLNHPEYGKFIIAHEMAHFLSYFFKEKKSETSYKKYISQRKCAGNVNNKVNAGEPRGHTHKSDRYRSEENMADIISYKAYRKEKRLLSCTYLDVNQSGDLYHDLDFFKDFQQFNDSHSNSFFRVIREAIHKKINFSNSCQQLIDIYGDSLRLDPCF